MCIRDSICDRVDTAEHNIDRLYAVEHADINARRKELYELRKDLIEARTESTGGVAEEASRLIAVSEEIDAAAPEFMDRYLELVERAATLFGQIQTQLQKENEADELTARPRIDEPSFYPGVGYHGFVPFMAISSWNSASVASSPNVSSNFSSGFSGAGGASSF